MSNAFISGRQSKASKSWDKFATNAYTLYGDMGNTSSSNMKTTPNPVLEMPPILPDVEMTPVDQTVTPETSQKKDKQKAHVTDNKKVKNQSTMANPDAQTSATQPQQVRDIIVYDIPYTWDVEKILGELMLWSHTIKLSVKRQHKYQTLKVKIVLNSFTLLQFNKFWMINLGGIPYDRKPQLFLQTSQGKRKLKLKWCQHSIPTLKKKYKLKAQNTPNNKSGNTGQSSNSNQPTKKDKKSSTKTAKDDNQLKNPNSQKAKKSSKSKGCNIINKEILAEILDLLRRLN
ncbi:hypothetical protein RhiirA5_408516 [Rhizophagus irregularis]|uniref:Uncharacterized protein n=1 Tax=Rhizophagus irregularis TaxID=588596 RepID=A0A2N0Q840_9GLOM|nr:hypothetical protein RhiirA5_408516 [Rhizophagus irregularis]